MPIYLIKIRRDTQTNWELADPVLASGEPGFDTTRGLLKIGDGVTVWSLLPSRAKTNHDYNGGRLSAAP